VLFDIDAAVPAQLVGDPLRLGQILINYANNAVKFTSSGEIHLQIQLREETEDEVVLYGAVKDTGIGLTPDQIDELFQSFQQADASTTRQFGGTGLGLAITKQLAGLMHGEVGVFSEFGKGSTFWFTVRLGKGSATPRRLALSSDLYGNRVLVVDDNESARLMMVDMLGSLNLLVDQAGSGKDAMAAVTAADAASRPYEILFLDWQMPVMNGIELARLVKASPLVKKPHVVLVTGYGREEVLKSAEDAGIEDVLIKPVNASMLFEGVVRVLGSVQEPYHLPMQAPEGAVQGYAALNGARVLLVEDNELNQEVASELLREAGLVVDIAENGQLAVDMVQRAPYDIVLMDMQMPVMDGLTATRAIRGLPQFQDLPILAMTANAMQGDRDVCSAAGMNDHIAKPIDPEKMFETLLRWTRSDHAGVAAIAPKNEPATEVRLPMLEGLDLASGLRRVLGKKGLYSSMLRRFMESQNGAVDQIRDALDAGEWERAERAAHTLKGVAGNVSMGPIEHAAVALEAAIKARSAPEQIKVLCQACEQVLQPFIAQLQQHFSDVGTARVAVMSDVNQLAALCKRLAELLAQDDMEASDVLMENAPVLESAFGGAYAGLEASIKAFDFETALQRLHAACVGQGFNLSH
jgi:two-component system sensor histidine kinase/response regulator